VYKTIKIYENILCNDSFGLGPREPVESCLKINSSNCSKVSELGIPLKFGFLSDLDKIPLLELN